MKRALAGVLLTMAAIGCRSPTEIRLEVTTDQKCTDWKGAAIAVGELGVGLENAAPSTSTTSCDDAGHVGSVVVIPSGADGANVAFKVVGAVDHGLEQCTEDAGYAGCIVARRALRFIPHETLTLTVPLEGACKDVPCTADETCVNGLCHSATIVDPTQCESTSCGESALPSQIEDGGAQFDATVNDGGVNDGSANDAGDGGSAIDSGSPGSCAPYCAVAVGAQFSCLLRDGGVTCWGQNYAAQLGEGAQDPPVSHGPVLTALGANLSGVTGIVAQSDTACAFLLDAGVACWGSGGGLGANDGGILKFATPQPLLGGSIEVTPATSHVCWRTDAVTLRCMGDDSNGQLGNGSDGTWTFIPNGSNLPQPYAQTASTETYSCGVTQSGDVHCVGANGSFQADPAAAGTGDLLLPGATIPIGSPAASVALAVTAACAVGRDAHVYCWGSTYLGQAGAPSTAQPLITEVTVASGPLSNVASLVAGSTFFCALTTDGAVDCWGEDDMGELGRGPDDAGSQYIAAPVLDSTGTPFGGAAGIAAGKDHVCAIKTNGEVWCWGENQYFETDPTTDGGFVTMPVRVPY